MTDIFNSLPDPPQSVYPENIAQMNMNHAIRATAGLLYWFAIEAGLQVTNPIPTYTYFTPPTGYNVHGQSTTLIPHCNGINPWYEINYRTCTIPTQGQHYGGLPQSGVSINIYDNNTVSARATVFNSNFAGQSCQPPNPPFNSLLLPNSLPVWVSVKAKTNGGTGGEVWAKVDNANKDGSGGCPYLFVQDDNNIQNTENNLLHKSQFYEYLNQDINDKYLLTNKPKLVDNKYMLFINEMDNETFDFDNIKLYEVVHPAGTKIAVTETNEIVMYDSVEVVSTDSATLNYTDITGNIQYHEARSSSGVSGDTLDQMFIRFPNTSYMNAAIITEFSKDKIILYPAVKDWLANYTIHTNRGDYTGKISRRENLSVNIIPINSARSITINDILLGMDRDFYVKYIAILPIYYTGFTVSELPLSSAILGDEIGERNVDSLLLNQDEAYLSLDSLMGKYITLFFDSSPSLKSSPTNIKDYILETNGKFVSINEFKTSYSKSEKNILPSPKLQINYPNPFNPKTLIKYELPDAQYVEIKVFNTIGQEVAYLVHDVLSKGYHQVEFDGSNFGSGVYFYQLRTNDYVETKKMVLIK